MPDKWSLAARCSVKGILTAVVFAMVAVLAGLQIGTFASVGISTMIAATLIAFALHGAWRLADALQAFAQTVPAQPYVEAETSGKACLKWPGLSITVESQAGLLREPPLEVQAGGQPLEGRIDEARDLAEEALAAVGIDPERPEHSAASEG